ncbi:hypothetical protein DFJ77DRAFT_421712, partial [Powellomyces hirtus]
VFLTGATGYIGGSVLSALLAHKKYTYEIVALVRGTDRAAKLKSLGVKTVQGSLDDAAVLEQYSRWADIVIHTADADHVAAAEAILKGMEAGAEGRQRKPILVHTSGTGVLLDKARGQTASDKIFHDSQLETYNTLPLDQPHRNVDVLVLEAGKRGKIDTVIVCPPLIYGRGTGPFNTISQQVPLMIRGALARGKAGYIGNGANIWSNVHVQDLAEFYVLLIESLWEGKAPVGAEGYYFCENGTEHDFRTLAQKIAEELKKQGGIGDGKADSVPEDQVEKVFGENAYMLLSGNSRSRADKARKLGWKPTQKGLYESVGEDVGRLLEE